MDRDHVPVMLPRRSVQVLLDLIANKLTTVRPLDREDRIEICHMEDARRALEQARC